MWTRINQNFPIPPDVREVISKITNAGFDAFLVGGSVRDFLRGEAVKDFDVATSAHPSDIIPLFNQAVEVGKAFGVVRVTAPETHRIIEIATFRSEGDYRDHRRPSRVKFSDLPTDANRRDFTVNALYLDVKRNEIYDAHGGMKDLADKKLRAIGVAQDRFKEDALRLLRAVRFSSRFGFKIEELTRLAIIDRAPLIRKISVERIRDELERILIHSRVRDGMIELEALGLLENVIPEISVAKLQGKKYWDQTLRALRVLGQYSPDIPEPAIFYWTMLMLPTFRLVSLDARENEARIFCERMKFSTEATQTMIYLVRSTARFREVFTMRDAKLLRFMKEADFELLMRFHELDALAFDGNLAGLGFVRKLYPVASRRFEMKPYVSGEDLMRLGLKPGPKFSDILRTLEDLQLEGTINTTDEGLEYVLKNFV